MADNDLTYYYLEEFTGKWVKDENGKDFRDKDGKRKLEVRTGIATSLARVYRKHGTLFTSEEQFVDDFLASDAAQRIAGVKARVATAEDLDAYSDSLSVFKALENFKKADQEAARVKSESRETVVNWFAENVVSEEIADYFFQMHSGINPWLFTSWVRQWERRDSEGNNPKQEMPAAANEALKAINAKLAKSKTTKKSPKGTAKEQQEQIDANREFMSN